MNTPYRLGYCCKWLDPDQTQPKKTLDASQQPMNQRGTTLTRLRAMDKEDAAQYIQTIVEHNCQALWRQLEWSATLAPELRLFRITSEFVPGLDVADISPLLERAGVQSILEERLSGIRAYADQMGIRLCSHPGQYSNICSTSEDVVKNAIQDIESHAWLAGIMGYRDEWHPSGFCVNIHANINQDPDLSRFKSVFARMSPHVQRLLTVENDEFGCGLDDILRNDLDGTLPVVLDFHHHWIRSKGEYIAPSDPRIGRVQTSWRGLRPLAHASTSMEEELKDHPPGEMPDYAQLEAQGKRARHLQSHSYLMWNHALNRWLSTHLAWTDIEIEAKGKNLASTALYENIKSMREIDAASKEN